MKRLARYTAVVLGTVFIVYLFYQFRQVLMLFLMSLLMAAALRPFYQSLANRGISPKIALPLIYAGVILILAGLLFIVGRQLVNDLQTMVGEVATWYEAAYFSWTEGPQIEQLLTTRLPAPNIVLETLTTRESGSLFTGAANVTMKMLGAAGAAAAVLVISVYWTADRTHFERIWLALLPANHRAGAREIWRTTEDKLGAYIRSEGLQSGAAAILLGLVYWLVGMPYAIVLALVGGLAWFIPLVGPVFVIAPVILIGISSGDPFVTIAAVLAALITLSLLEFVIEPRLFNRRQYNPMLSLVLMLILAQEFGLLGLLAGPPLAAALQLLFVELLLKRSKHAARAQLVSEQIHGLKRRLARTVETIDEDRENGSAPKYTNLANRLDDLIQQTEEAFAEEPATEP